MINQSNVPLNSERNSVDIVSLLGKLAHKGAYLSFDDPDKLERQDGKVYSPLNNYIAPVLVIEHRLAETAASQGLISPGCAKGRQRISLGGRRLLKAVRSCAGEGDSECGDTLGNSKSDPGGGTKKAVGSNGAEVCANTKRESRNAGATVGRFVECEVEPGSARTMMIDTAESPLGWLRRRKDNDGLPMIDDAQFQAGERLREEFYRGQMTPRVTADWSGEPQSRRRKNGGPGGAAEMSESAMAARQRVRRALEAVGPQLSGVLIDVCCHLKGLGTAERGSVWPQRSGKVVLTLALDALALHYGLATNASLQQKKYVRTLHWGDEDYKPVMDVE